MARLKILSDFDGVWTDQGPEAAALVGFCIETLAGLAGVEVDAAAAELAPLRQAMGAAPHEHGWAPDGRISAFVDEDPLIESSALCRFIGASDDPVARRYRGAVLGGGFDSLDAFAQHVFYKAQHPPCLVPDAAALMASLHDAGAEVVIVSNSGSDKINAWFGEAGIEGVRVRGDAAKWRLGGSDAAIDVGGRTIYVDRPRYREAIEAEQPDMVIGDVFSLDLAMPHVLRTHGLRGAPQCLVLRHRPHTPAWVLETAGGGAIDHIVAGIGDLPEILETLR